MSKYTIVLNQDGTYTRTKTTEDAVRDIPGWATWTEAEAVAWVDANIADPSTATALKAMARMMIALRDETWPNLSS